MKNKLSHSPNNYLKPDPSHNHEHHHHDGDCCGGTPHVNENKIGRNDLCHCGSGKKYKKCCID